jgi:hypothetical protein
VGGVTTENLMALINTQAGSGSGLDADLLDGKEAEEFVQLDSFGRGVSISGIDLNGVTNTGFYQGNNLTNAPDGNFYYFLVIKNAESFIMQQAFALATGTENWIRFKISGTWQEWKKLWFEGNHGAGSGLDADKLDGLEADAFHKKTENITLNGKYISNNGQTEGISVENGGDVSFTGNAKVNGFLNIGKCQALIILNGEITVSKSYHTVKGEEGETSVDLNTINGGKEGNILVLQATSVHCPVTVKDNTGNIRLSGDFILHNNTQKLILLAMDFRPYGGIMEWHELSRSSN